MYIKVINIFILLIVTILTVNTSKLSANNSTEKLRGKVQSKNKDGEIEVLQGANVYWMNTGQGVFTDQEGRFEIEIKNTNKNQKLIISYIGYKTDTILVRNKSQIDIFLEPSFELSEVEVTAKRNPNYISTELYKTEVITSVELTKAACCDLTACFETSSSVDVKTTDLITGQKELQLIGLPGIYTQILQSGQAYLFSGLNRANGLNSIPGTLIQDIFITKGSNSVLHGHEGISGIIDVRLKEPDKSEKLFVNVYVNSFMEKQSNLNYSFDTGKWQTLIAGHLTLPANEIDRNDDGFLDLAQVFRAGLTNTWLRNLEDENGWVNSFTLRLLNEERTGGQTGFDRNKHLGTTGRYGQTMDNQRLEFSNRNKYHINDKNSVNFLLNAALHKQEAYYGITRYTGTQVNHYSRLYLQRSWNTAHQLNAGLNYRYDKIESEVEFTDSLHFKNYAGNYDRLEKVPGIFIENIFNWKEDKYILISGFRLDNHNLAGLIPTYRMLLKYEPKTGLALQLMGGTGFRYPDPVNENTYLFASSRDIILDIESKHERTYNTGGGLVYNTTLNKEFNLILSADYYYTYIVDYMDFDIDSDPNTVYISNKNINMTSGILQLESSIEYKEVLTLKAAYINSNYKIEKEGNIPVDKPMTIPHKYLIVFDWTPLNEKWRFNTTSEIFSSQRLPKTDQLPEDLQMSEYAKSYFTVNIQWTQVFKQFELYAGIENILDYRQYDPVLDPSNPFGNYFDTSYNWGPVRGREIYIGARYIIK